MKNEYNTADLLDRVYCDMLGRVPHHDIEQRHISADDARAIVNAPHITTP